MLFRLGKILRVVTIGLLFFKATCFAYSSSGEFTADTSKINHILNKAFSHINASNDSALTYFRRAGDLCREVLDKQGNQPDRQKTKIIRELYAKSLINIGIEQYYKGKHAEALDAYNEALQTARELGDSSIVSECYGEIGIVHKYLGNYDEALKSYRKALYMARQATDTGYEAICLNNIGVVFRKMGAHEKALRYFLDALKIYESIDEKGPMADICNNVGLIHDDLGDVAKAKEYLERSLSLATGISDNNRTGRSMINLGSIFLQMNENDRARQLFERSLEIYQSMNYQQLVDDCHFYIGNTWEKAGDPGKAISHYLKSIEISKKTGDSYNHSMSLSKLANVYFKIGSFPKALTTGEMALKIAGEINAPEAIKEAALILSNASESNDNRTKALDYFRIYDSIKEVIFNAEKYQAVAEMQTKYETEKKDMELAMLQKEKEMDQAKMARNRLISISVIIFLLLLIAFLSVLYFYYRQRMQRKAMMMKHEYEKNLSGLQMLTIRNQLNPHFIFNVLNSMGFLVLKENRDKAYEAFTAFSDLIRFSLEYADKLAIPLAQELQFTHNYLQLEKVRFKDKIDFSISVAPEISDQQVIIPRMAVQVFAENALKHGLRLKKGQGLLNISVERMNGNMMIIIDDNGIGRQKAREMSTSGTGKGLEIIERIFEFYERLYQKSIEYSITDKYDSSDKPDGTRIEVKIPVGND